jgi:hypothetical protein
MAKEETTEVLQEENTDSADMMAEADRSSGDDAQTAIPYVVKLSKIYSWEGREIDSVDLTGLEDLTTKDAQEVDRIVSKLGHAPRNKWRDTLYTKHVAVKASGLPVEFFNQLRWRDMEEITSTVAYYFLLG